MAPRFIYLAIIAYSVGCKGAAHEEETAPPAPVKVASADKAAFGEWTELLGGTQPLPSQTARISAAIEGQVLWILSDGQGKPLVEGQQVKKGQVIVQLDDRVATANRDKVLATVDEVVEQKQQADLAERLARLDLDRLEKLRAGSNASESGLVSPVEVEKARLLLLDARSKQKGALAKERALQAELKVLEVQRDQFKLRAPIAGRLGTIQVVPGQTIPPATTVADVINLDDVDVLCIVPPHRIARLALEQPVRLLLNGASKTQPNNLGKVVFIGVQAQPETGNFPVKVRFPNRDQHLRANLVVRLQVLTQPVKERVVIPDSALMEDQDPPGIVIVQDIQEKKNKDGEMETRGKARKLRASIGIRARDRHLVEILKLEDSEKHEVPIAGAQFITEGGHGLHDGDMVKIEAKEH